MYFKLLHIITHYYVLRTFLYRIVYVSEFCGSDIVFANFDCIMSAGKALTPNESDEDEHKDICDEIQLEPEDNEPEDNGSPLPQPQLEMRTMIGLRLAGRKQWL